MKTLAYVLTASLAATAISAQAGSRIPDSDKWEQDLIREAQRDHARKVGGYNDPFTAFSNLLSGNLTEKGYRPRYQHLAFRTQLSGAAG